MGTTAESRKKCTMRAFGSPSSIFSFSSAYTLMPYSVVGPKSREVRSQQIGVAECPVLRIIGEEKLPVFCSAEGTPDVSTSGSGGFRDCNAVVEGEGRIAQ